MSAVLSIDKNKVRQSFASAATTYDGLAILQRSVGLELLNKLAIPELREKEVGNTTLDIGCGTGFITQEILSISANQQIFAMDIALSMVQVTKAKLENVDTVQYLCADAEYLPLLDQSVDTVVSNLAFQWCQNLTDVFNGLKRVLKYNGRMLFSTFGPLTLQELKQSWSEVDDYMHVNDFYSVDELVAFLRRSGFKDIQIETNCYQSVYPAVIDLMRELKGIGAHNVLSGRNRKLTSKTQMQSMIDAYEKYRKNELIPATYEIIFVSARVD